MIALPVELSNMKPSSAQEQFSALVDPTAGVVTP
jgi:hypothetical protein